MPFSTLLLSVATVGTTTLAFAIATPGIGARELRA